MTASAKLEPNGSLLPDKKNGTATPDPILPITQNIQPAEEITTTLPEPVTPISFSGPQINNRPTTVILSTPPDLAKTPLDGPITDMINDAFLKSHVPAKIMGTVQRLRGEDAFSNQVGIGPGVFTYVVTFEGTTQVLGTVSARPFNPPADWDAHHKKLLAEPDSNKRRGLPFARLQSPKRRQPELECEMWELKLMAVDPGLQRQGLAAYLMQLAEDEVVRRANEANGKELEVLMVMTTVKELAGPFYEKKGYELDYENWNEPGTLDSFNGFTISHSSKHLKVEE